MNITNVVLKSGYENTIPVVLPTNLQIDVSQILGVVPISKGGTGATDIDTASQNLDYFRKNKFSRSNTVYPSLIINGYENSDSCCFIETTDYFSMYKIANGNGKGFLELTISGKNEDGYTYLDGYINNDWMGYNFNDETMIRMYSNKLVANKEYRIQYRIDGTLYNPYGEHNVIRGDSAITAGSTFFDGCYYNQYA